MANLPYPEIDKERCTGCHLCVDVCPTDALAQVAGKARLAYPDRCTYCTLCEDKCPEGAISLPFLITFHDISSDLQTRHSPPAQQSMEGGVENEL